MQKVSRHQDSCDTSSWRHYTAAVQVRNPPTRHSNALKKRPPKTMKTFAKNTPKTPDKNPGGIGVGGMPEKALQNSLFFAPGSKVSAKWRNINVFGAMMVGNFPIFSIILGVLIFRQILLKSLAFWRFYEFWSRWCEGS